MKLTQAYPGLIADPLLENFTRKVNEAHFSFTNPSKVKNPTLLAWSTSLANELGLHYDNELLQVLSGNIVLNGSQPLASRYGGHQFGQWAGQLGDGRAITLGEFNSFEIQLKV